MMRKTGRNPDVRYVALSGFGQEVDKERSAAAGFAAHLVKPIGFEALGKLLGVS
ncbi:CheY-like chemotaxis protein [Massilia sp. UYP11]